MSEELRVLNRYDVAPVRAVRKKLYVVCGCGGRPVRVSIHNGVSVLIHNGATLDVRTTTNTFLGPMTCRSRVSTPGRWAKKRQRSHVQLSTIALIFFVITETWHKNSESTSLKRIVLPGCQCTDAARFIPPGAANTANFQNYGGLAFVYSDVIKCRKITIMSVSTFEYLCGLMSTSVGHVVLLGVYRPGSQALSEAFFDELSAVLERLSTYNCPIVVCGDFNVHVDQPEDVNAVRLKQLLQSFDC